MTEKERENKIQSIIDKLSALEITDYKKVCKLIDYAKNQNGNFEEDQKLSYNELCKKVFGEEI